MAVLRGTGALLTSVPSGWSERPQSPQISFFYLHKQAWGGWPLLASIIEATNLQNPHFVLNRSAFNLLILCLTTVKSQKVGQA
jgi:hypothetical protein